MIDCSLLNMLTLLKFINSFFSLPLLLEIIVQAPNVDLECDSIENKDDHSHSSVDTPMSALAFAVDGYGSSDTGDSLDSDAVGFVYVVVKDGDADGDRLLRLAIISNTAVTSLPAPAAAAAADTSASMSNPFRAECTVSLPPSASSQVVCNITLQGTTNQEGRRNSLSSSRLLLLLCGRHPQGKVTEIRLLNTTTLCTLAILDLATASRPAFSLASRGHTTTKLHTNAGDRDNNGSEFEYFYGAAILTNYCEHASSSSSSSSSSCATRSEPPNDGGSRCLIAIFAKTAKLTHHQLSQQSPRSGSQTAANNTSNSFDDGCKLLFWQPVIDDVPAGATKADRSKLTSLRGAPITLLAFPFRCILSATTAKGKLPRPRFSSSDGSLSNGFLAGPTYLGRPPTFVNAATAASMASQWRCNVLLTLDTDEQLWNASTEPTTNFPGPMYPPGFQIMTRVEKYVEQEDDLDFVVNGSSSSAESNDSAIDVSERTQKQQQQVDNFISVGVARRFVRSRAASNKLPLRILSPAEREELMCTSSHQQPTAASLETAGKKRKRVAEETQQLSVSATVGAEQAAAAVIQGPRGLSLLDVLPLPRRVCTTLRNGCFVSVNSGVQSQSSA